MEYCYLGKSGLQVSRIGLGAIPFGTKIDEKTSQRIVDMYQDIGGNLIDTANLYGGGLRGSNSKMAGTSERTVGRIIKGRRDQFVIATKGYWLMEDEVKPNNVGLSRTYLTTQIEASLRRLDTDYIDFYQCHSWDYYTPVEETVRVLDDFVRAGKIRYIGVSNWDGWHVVKANSYAKHFGFTPIISNQIWYTLADRVAENSIIPACRDQNVSIIAWGALAEGFLTGRYNRKNLSPDTGTRFDMIKEGEMLSWKNLAVERNWKTLEVLERIAKQYAQTVPNIAMRWLLDAGTCDVVLMGVSNLEQFKSNLNVINLQLSKKEAEELRQVSEQTHPYPICFHALFCKHDSEFYGGLR